MRKKNDETNYIDFEPVFKQLNEELSKINEALVLICAGGYVMQLHGYRTTVDVDAFYKSSVKIENIIRYVGNSFGINNPNELWLNSSIANLNTEPPAKYCTSVHKFSNLEVRATDITYVIGMKFESAREQDLRDISAILKLDNNKEPLELRAKLIDMGFAIDISLLLEAFESAHGMDWFEGFYKNNEAELCKYY
jgi:hypothetical protein